MPNKNDINIELLYPSDLFLKGEELFENKCVTELAKVEKGLFNFIVKDGTNIEVEWLKPLTRYQKATCVCNYFKENKVCRHIIAALIAYKDHVKHETKEVQVVEKNSVLNINNVLNGVSKDELKNFIKAYARSDKKFSTAIKVQFARKVNLRDNEKKYKSLLDSVVRPISSDKNPIKISDSKALLHIVEDFHSQAQDSLALSEYGEAFYLCKVSLSKLCYVYHNTDFIRTELENEIVKNHILLRQLLMESESHELSENIIDFLKELIQYSYYAFIDIKENGIILLNDFKFLPEDIFETIKLQLSRKKEEELQIVLLLAIEVILKFELKQPVMVTQKYQTYLSKVGTLLLNHNKLDVCIEFCKNYLQNGGDVLLIYLKAQKAKGSKHLVAEMAKWFVQAQNLSIVDYAISALSQDEQLKFRSEVAKHNKKDKVNPIKFFYYLAKTGQLQELLEGLKQKSDFRILMQYDQYLLPHLEDELALLYESLLEEYLNNHIGNHSQTFITEIFVHLSKIKANKVIKKLGLLIDMKFSHRIGLDDIYKVQH